MGQHLAFGTLLLILGGAFAVSRVPLLLAAGWIAIAIGCVLIVAHVAVGPTPSA